MHRYLRTLSVLFIFTCVAYTQEANAFGKRRVLTRKPAATPAASDTQAYPARTVSIGTLYDAQFFLPDGKTKVDSGLALKEILLTEISRATAKLHVEGLEIPASEPGSENQRFVIRGGITAFEANLTEWGLRFGYQRGTGDIGEGTAIGLNGEAKVQVGRLEVDFYIFDKKRREIVGVGSGDARLLGLNLNITANFDDLETGMDFVRQAKVAAIFRSVVREAISNLVKSPRTNFLMDWERTVSAVDVDTHVLFFGAGTRDDIKVGDLFEIYDGNFPVGVVRVNTVGRDNAKASYKDDESGALLRGTREGDRVLIYFKETPK